MGWLEIEGIAVELAFISARDGLQSLYVVTVGQPDSIRRVGDGVDWWPEWSPDGRHIAFTRNSETHIIDADGAGLRSLGDSPSLWPTWAPDGGRLAFMSYREGTTQWANIYTISVDGTGLRRITDSPPGNEVPAWGPTDLIAFSTLGEEPDGVYTMRPDGSARTRLTHLEVHCGRPSWAPDGAWLAYEANYYAKDGIRLIRADGTDDHPLRNSQPGDADVTWAPHGNRIAFVRNGAIYIINRDGTDLEHVVEDASAPTFRPFIR